MEAIDWERVAIVAASLGGLVSGLVSLWVQWGKVKADERGGMRDDNREDVKTYTDAAKALIEPLEKRVREQEERIKRLEDENGKLRVMVQLFSGGVRILVQQLRENGIAPRWVPPGEVWSMDE